MRIDISFKIALIIFISCAVLFAVLFTSCLTIPKKEYVVAWREEFLPASRVGYTAPTGWKLERKPGTRSARFSIVKNHSRGMSFLRMKADRASATLITTVHAVDLEKTPFLQWRWRAIVLPQGADGRERARDDQAIGIYVGTGRAFNNKSISYRWDTNTPKGAEGLCLYNMGMTRVGWHTLRNKEDAKTKEWFIENRNVAEDFKKAWGFYPHTIYLAISSNSQYTHSSAVADLDWIEFVSNTAEGGT